MVDTNIKELIIREANLNQAQKLDPDNLEIIFDLGLIQNKLNKFKEAEKNFLKALKFDLKNPRIYFNLALSQQNQKNFINSEQNYLKAVELKSDYFLAYYNLAIVQIKLNKLDQAIIHNENVLKINPTYKPANHNLKFAKRLKNLLDTIKDNNYFNSPVLDTDLLITKRITYKKEIEFLSNLVIPTISETLSGPLFGNGFTSNYELFNINNNIINSIKNDLSEIVFKSLGSKIFIMDSFLNNLKGESGSKIHNHIGDFDVQNNLINRKYSLVYYLSTGDQSCTKPGILKLYEPSKEILPNNDMILIWPAKRFHSSSYNGSENRLMIGLNFYLLS